MDTNKIVAEIDSEIARLMQAKSILSGLGDSPTFIGQRSVGRPKKVLTASGTAATKKRTMSPEGKAKIAAAQKARWAKAKRTSVKSKVVSAPAGSALGKAAKNSHTQKATRG